LMHLGVSSTGGPASRLRLTKSLGFARSAGPASPPARSATGGGVPAAPALEARLVLRKDRLLTFEIDVEAPLDWRPGKAIVRWSDGTTVGAEVIVDQTTAAGLVTPGLTVRLTLRVADDNPAAAPVEIMMPTRHGPLTLRVRRA